MKKIYKLFINENMKTWKKISTSLAIVFCILFLIIVLGLTKFTEYTTKKAEKEFYKNNDWSQIAQNEIKECNEQLLDDTLEQEKKEQIKVQIEVYELSLKYNIALTDNNWKSEILTGLLTSPQINEELVNLIKNDDFKGYMKLKKDEEKKLLIQKEITQKQYEDEMLILDLCERCGIGKDSTSTYHIDNREILVQEIRNMQDGLRREKNIQTQKVLSSEDKKEYEDMIKMNIYKIENNIETLNGGDIETSRMSFEILAVNVETVIIAIFAIIIAGGAISSEISSGTIKFLALTPNKRWKILTAKILSLLFYIFVLTFIMSLLTILCGNIFFDTPGNEYVYIKDGNVEKLGNIEFIMGYYFLEIVPVIFFAIISLMFSVIIRNSSFAIGASVAIYMSSGTIMLVLNKLIKKDWMKYVPFNNLNIFEKVFSNFQGFTETTSDIITTTPLGFSVAVLGICIILMLITTYDSFNNRDIV